ncbi:hypothetical protein [Azospirillum sp. A39]|uniref:hypothetical protein n=1 Tax=Azospirillum sp. A39 TaxID=3462279 RepID=UPI004045CDB5
MNALRTPLAARIANMARMVAALAGRAHQQAPGQIEVLAGYFAAQGKEAERFDLVAAVRLERLADEIRGRAAPFAPYSAVELQYLASRINALAAAVEAAEAMAPAARPGGGSAA